MDTGSRSSRPQIAAFRGRLPRRRVSTQQEMTVLLDEFDWLLRAKAVHALGEGPDADQVVQRIRRRMIAMAHPSYDHALKVVTHALWNECYAVLRRRARDTEEIRDARARGLPIDPALGVIDATKREAAKQLSALQRRRLEQAWSGLRPAEIAAAEGRSPGVIRLALHAARQRVLQILEEGKKTAPAWLALLPLRVRHSLNRWLRALVDVTAPQPIAGLVPVMVCSLWCSAGAVPAPAGPIPTWHLTAARTQSVEEGTRSVAEVRPAGIPAPQRPPAIPMATAVVRSTLRGAAAETPEDVRLTAAATPPGTSNAVVAIGRGQTCGCPVLLRSLDGGATWQATDGPPADANQLVLPPAYPADSRIFAGVSELDATGAPYMATAFGPPFQRLATLPPGQLAVSSHFDAGDPRLFSSAVTGVWSLALTNSSNGAPREEIVNSPASVAARSVAALATPTPGTTSPAVVVWAPSLATVPAAAGQAPTMGAALVECATSGSCNVVGSPPATPWQLAVGRGGSTLLAYTHTTAFLSRDGGRTFAPLPLPASANGLQSMALLGAASLPWVSAAMTDGSRGVLMAGVDGRWLDATGGAALLRTHLATLVAVGDRVMAMLSDAGYRCAVVGPAPTWQPRCP